MVTDRMQPLTRRRAATCTRSALPVPLGPPRAWSPATRPTSCSRWCSTSTCTSPSTRSLTCDVRPGRRPRGAGAASARRGLPAPRAAAREPHDSRGGADGPQRYGDEAQPRVGFFTDTSALHRLQGVRGGLQGVEPASRRRRRASPATPTTTRSTSAPTPGATSRSSSSASRSAPTARRSLVQTAALAARRETGLQTYQDGDGMRWLMASDVCKHCTHAACLEVCPTGALFRTEFGTVVVQEDICNGCGYCVPGLPVRRARPARGRRARLEVHALLRPPQGRQGAGLRAGVPDELDPVRRARRAARARRARGSSSCRTAGLAEARLYGADPDDGVGGFGAFFLLLDEPEAYGLPPDPVDTTRDLGGICGRRPAPRRRRSAAALAAAVLVEARGERAESATARRSAPTTAGR